MAPTKKFSGYCDDGDEIHVYKDNGANVGSAQERVARCSAACRANKTPVAGSWTGFVAKGFAVIPSTGNCYCESADSATCKRKADAKYNRYDWDMPGL